MSDSNPTISPDPKEFLASRLYDANPRIPIIVNDKPVAMLRLMPAPNVHGPSGNIENGIAIELVITDPQLFAQRIRQVNNKLICTIRVFDTQSANTFFSKCLAYTWQIHLSNLVATPLRELYEKATEMKQRQQQPQSKTPIQFPFTIPTQQQQADVEKETVIEER